MSNTDTDTDAGEAGDLEARARRMGWRPEEEWDDTRGTRRPTKFLTAEEYLDKVANDLPVLRERNRFLDETVSKLGKEVGEVNARLTETNDLVRSLHDANKTSVQRGRDQMRRELEQHERDAVLEADPDKFDAAKAKLKELDKLDEPPVVQSRTGEPAKVIPKDPVTAAWVSENEWFTKDKVLNAVAIAENVAVNEQTPGISAADALAETKRRVMERYPEKFSINPRRQERGPATPGVPSEAERRTNGKKFSDLPDDAKNAFTHLQKVMKDKGVEYKQEEYLEQYIW